ncbi:hypothetical protein ACLB2K_027780 [Fragaria x ananassa]
MTLFFNFACAAQPYDDPPYHVCSVVTDDFAGGSTFQENVKSILELLHSNASVSKLESASIGNAPDRVYALYMCLGFVSNDTCQKCIAQAQASIMGVCSMSKEAIVWLEACQLRYSNKNFSGRLDMSNYILQVNKENITDPQMFKSVGNQTLTNLTMQVADNDSFPNKMYATGEVLHEDEKIYALVQCTTDLSGSDCDQCLRNATKEVLREYFFAMGARLLSRNCYLRYELYSFYDDATQASKGGNKFWLITTLVSISVLT